MSRRASERNRTQVRPLSVLCGSLLGAVVLAAGTGPMELPAREILRHFEAPGVILTVRRGGGAGTVSAGLADLAAHRAMPPTTPYRLGSITKTYTATVVLQLVDEGTIGLYQPLADFLPDFPRAEEITVHQLLHHTSGAGDLAVWIYFHPNRDEMIRLATREWTRDELLARMAELEFDFPPGTDWSYSNSNYILAGAMIEEATGNTLAEELRARIFEPLDLTHTWLEAWEEPHGQLAATGYLGPLPLWPHSEMFGDLGPTTILDRGNMEWGAGGIVSTGAEATRFLDALLGGELLSNGSLAAMRGWIETPSLGAPVPETPADIESAYGLGLARSLRDGYRMIGHGGLYNGHTAGLWHVPECDATFAYYVNRGFVDGRWIMDRLVDSLGDDCAATLEPAES